VFCRRSPDGAAGLRRQKQRAIAHQFTGLGSEEN